MIKDADKKRFWCKYEVSDSECWDWVGPLDKDGYGTFWFARKNRRAHRFSWFMINGQIPDGMVINHTCRNRRCVNPHHLSLITKSENAIVDSDSIPARNAAKTHCKNGHEFDRKYGNQRYCSICEAEKRRRLRAKWKEDAFTGC